jgi:hypothetical protein
MERNQINESLELINNPDYSIQIFILDQPEITDKGLTVDFYKAHLDDELPKDIRALFFPVIKKKLISKEYSIQPYDPALTPDKDVVWTQESYNVPFFNLFHKLIQDAPEDNWYNSTKLKYDDIWAYWIKVYGKGNTFYIIKKVTASKVLKTGGKLALIFKDDVFKNLNTDVLTMDGTFDAIFFNDTLMFENKQNFEKALLYQQVKQEVAEATLNDISQIGLVEDFDKVKEFLKDDYHSINKLNKIKERPYFKTLTFATCKQIIQDYNIKIDIDEANGKFNLTTKEQAKLFIKLLNDDFLISEMTNAKYDATSKGDV